VIAEVFIFVFKHKLDFQKAFSILHWHFTQTTQHSLFPCDCL